MDYSILIKNQFSYHASVVFGLDIQGPTREFPLLVGCSLLTPRGEEVDLPARWLKSPGLAIWSVKADAQFLENPRVTPDDRVWSGRIIFALWRDDTFTERLTDTGWVNWRAYSLIGSSTAGVNMQDDQIKSGYGNRLDVWSDRKSGWPTNDPLGIR